MRKKYNYSKSQIKKINTRIKHFPFNILFVGVTGAGKSSLINALLGSNVAKIGEGTEPETKRIKRYKLDHYFQFRDSPGLGDSPENDMLYLQNIKNILRKKRKANDFYCKLIDMVIIVIDGSRRDFSELFSLLNNAVYRYIPSDNVLFVINQADQAMKGRHWDHKNATPDETLQHFLKEQAKTFAQRLEQNTGQKITLPLCCSATEKFNIDSLMKYIITNLPYQQTHINEIRTKRKTYSFDYDDDDDD